MTNALMEKTPAVLQGSKQNGKQNRKVVNQVTK
jgi:hypothetical protein